MCTKNITSDCFRIENNSIARHRVALLSSVRVVGVTCAASVFSVLDNQVREFLWKIFNNDNIILIFFFVRRFRLYFWMRYEQQIHILKYKKMRGVVR
jgi:hypothetical protein